MIHSDFRIAAAGWEAEVDQVAADLIRRGVPPYVAMREATEIVQERRRERDYRQQRTRR